MADHFILQPKKDDYGQLQDIPLEEEQRSIHRRRRRRRRRRRTPYFDEVKGRGHITSPRNYWQSLLGGTGTNWKDLTREAASVRPCET